MVGLDKPDVTWCLMKRAGAGGLDSRWAVPASAPPNAQPILRFLASPAIIHVRADSTYFMSYSTTFLLFNAYLVGYS